MRKQFFLHLLAIAAVLSVVAVGCKDDYDNHESVSLSHPTHELFVEQTLNLSVASGGSTSSVRWTTSNSEVASVRNGLVTALALGTATINAITPDGRVGVSIINVISFAESIDMGREADTMVLNDTLEIKFVLLPEDAVTEQLLEWSSSDITVATVDSLGRVAAIDTGDVVITAKAVRGDAVGTIPIRVRWQPVDSVWIRWQDRTMSTLLVGRTQQYTSNLRPENASNKAMKWESSDPDVVTVTPEGLARAISPGTAHITLTADEEERYPLAARRTSVVTVVEEYPSVNIVGLTWAPTNVSFDRNDSIRVFDARPDVRQSTFYQWNRLADTMRRADTITVPHVWNELVNSPCPEGWRLPTGTELSALRNVGSTWASPTATGTANKGNSVPGRFYGPNHATCVINNLAGCIFLPAQGYRSHTNGSHQENEVRGTYWSSSGSDHNTNSAFVLTFITSAANSSAAIQREASNVTLMFKTSGFNARCVAE